MYNTQVLRKAAFLLIIMSTLSISIAKFKSFKKRAMCLVIGFFFFLSFVTPVSALTFVLPPHGEDIVGHVQWTQALPGDTFNKIGRRYDMGYFELVEANPMINPEHPEPGSIIVIPSRFILPPKRQGLVINLAELRIYYYPPHRHVVITYPVGIGREGWDTPLGPSWIAEKMRNPIWTVPESIRKDRAKEGVYLPVKVPPGPDNPLGGYAMRLKQATYLIHGTNDSQGVGRRSSAGCIRLFPEDIESLFSQVTRKEKVTIIDLPYKFGWEKHRLFLEAHVPLQKQPLFNRLTAKKLLRAANNSKAAKIQWQSVERISLRENGIPQVIGYPTTPLKHVPPQRRQKNKKNT
ncbi:MAG: LysM protein [Pseudomonadota bacterium]|jgi:L,D-transpeptidase ErfK/SrfK|nr:LysM protein [Pseudomonadota bacterium]